MTRSRPKKIIWAVDAQQCSQATSKGIAAAIGDFLGSESAIIEPVYVLTPDVSVLPLAWFKDITPELRVQSFEKISKCTSHLKLKGLQKANILLDGNKGIQRAVDRLISYALKVKADLVVVQTCGKVGLPRLFLGSFAETLLLESKISILTVGPNYKRKSRTRTILCPVDFESLSEASFGKICEHARKTKARLVVLHALPPSFKGPSHLDPALVPSASLIYSQLTEEQERRRMLTIEYSNKAKAMGIQSKAVFDHSEAQNSVVITHAAKVEKVSIIAMATRNRRLPLFFPGSVTRQVVRASPCPVWVISNEQRH